MWCSEKQSALSTRHSARKLFWLKIRNVLGMERKRHLFVILCCGMSLLCTGALGAVAHVKVVAQVVNSTSGISSMTFTLQASNTNDAVLFGVGCNATAATPSAVSMSATGWTFTPLSG